LMRRYGVMGQRLYRLARGIDDRPVEISDGAKSVSAETTFNHDISKREELVPILRELSEKVAWRLKTSASSGHTVVLKLKTGDFKSRSRNRRLDDPTQLADKIFRIGIEMLDKELDGTAFRLIGIGVSDLRDPALADPPDLVDHGASKRAAAEAAMDKIREKFGKGTVETGFTFGTKKH
jgi:DNA polymerase-4